MKNPIAPSIPHPQVAPPTSFPLLKSIRTGLLGIIIGLSPIANAQPTTQINIEAQALLNDWTGPHGGVPPFDKVRSELFQPAFEAGTKQLLAEVDAIANQSEPPSFKNTIEALEKTGKAIDNLSPLFFTMTSNMNSPEYQKLSGVIRPMLSGVYDQIYFNNKLFARVTAIYQARQTSGLNAEQIRLVEQNYDSFIRRGARLSPDQKEKMGAINQELAKVFTEFVNKVQGDEDTWIVLSEKDLGVSLSR